MGGHATERKEAILAPARAGGRRHNGAVRGRAGRSGGCVHPRPLRIHANEPGMPGPGRGPPSPPVHTASFASAPQGVRATLTSTVRTADSVRTVPHESAPRALSAPPLTLTARLSPVAVLACAGWALTSGPLTATQDTAAKDTQKTPVRDGFRAPSTTANSKTYGAAPALPHEAPAAKTITTRWCRASSRPARRSRPRTPALRRTCSWNALKGYDYRWLDVSFEITDSDERGRRSRTRSASPTRAAAGSCPGSGTRPTPCVNLTTEDKQQTRGGRGHRPRRPTRWSSSTTTAATSSPSKAPATDEINKGAIKAAKEAGPPCRTGPAAPPCDGASGPNAAGA